MDWKWLEKSAREKEYTLETFMQEGLSSKAKGVEYDPEQLRMGIEVELEHTSNREIAEKIARDHLSELPDYYSRLKTIEKG